VADATIFQMPEHFDADLTEKGRSQCRKASTMLPLEIRQALASDQKELIVLTSTLSRAVQTAKELLPGVRRVMAIDAAREWGGGLVCDSRRRWVSFFFDRQST
jgi:broad specificity phosphatase PhoE